VANAKWESGDVKDLPPFARRAIRKNVCDRYGGRCAYCDIYVGMKGTVDHYVPQALGGQHQPHNLRWCCISCNNLKGDMSPKDWEAKKPPRVQHETKHEKRIRLLSGIAQRGYVDWFSLGILAFVIVCILTFIYALIHYDPVRCVEGYKFYRGVGDTHTVQILDAEGRAIRCEGVRSSAGKPLT
jgi:hypothetical protein